jgi:Uma2 family endonuclease
MSVVLHSNDQPALPARPIRVEEYHGMGEAGIFAPDERLELIEGEVVEMAPIGTRHAACVTRLGNLLGHMLFGRAIVSTQNPVVLSDLSEPQPDLAVLRLRENYYAAAHPRPEDILLLIEVADSSIDYDRGVKLPLYARHGVPEIRLIDLNASQLEVYRDPVGGEYRDLDHWRRGMVAPTRLPDASVPLEAMFPSLP